MKTIWHVYTEKYTAVKQVNFWHLHISGENMTRSNIISSRNLYVTERFASSLLRASSLLSIPLKTSFYIFRSRDFLAFQSLVDNNSLFSMQRRRPTVARRMHERSGSGRSDCASQGTGCMYHSGKMNFFSDMFFSRIHTKTYRPTFYTFWKVFPSLGR